MHLTTIGSTHWLGNNILVELWAIRDELQFAKSIRSTHLIVELYANLILNFL